MGWGGYREGGTTRLNKLSISTVATRRPSSNKRGALESHLRQRLPCTTARLVLSHGIRKLTRDYLGAWVCIHNSGACGRGNHLHVRERNKSPRNSHACAQSDLELFGFWRSVVLLLRGGNYLRSLKGQSLASFFWVKRENKIGKGKRKKDNSVKSSAADEDRWSMMINDMPLPVNAMMVPNTTRMMINNMCVCVVVFCKQTIIIKIKFILAIYRWCLEDNDSTCFRVSVHHTSTCRMSVISIKTFFQRSPNVSKYKFLSQSFWKLWKNFWLTTTSSRIRGLHKPSIIKVYVHG